MSRRWIALLARRRPEYRGTDRVLNIGHRGAGDLAPENTLVALDRAAEAGADMVEIDVHLSRDRELIVRHDFDGSLSLEDVRERHPDTPTLAECITRAQQLGLLLNVEIKNLPARYPGIEAQVVATVRRLDAVLDVLISSFDHEALAAVRALNDAVATAVLTQDRLYQPLTYLMRLDADALHPGGYVPDRALADTIRASHRGVNVWTENDPATMRRLVASGVTGIITDYPNRLRTLLDGHP